MKPCGHAGPDGQGGRASSTTLPTCPCTGFACAHDHKADDEDCQRTGGKATVRNDPASLRSDPGRVYTGTLAGFRPRWWLVLTGIRRAVPLI